MSGWLYKNGHILSFRARLFPLGFQPNNNAHTGEVRLEELQQ